MIPLNLEVNGQAVTTQVSPTTLLIDLLRGPLALTGTHAGCDTAQCGACTVLVDGAAVKSCSVLAVQVQGQRITTVEGLAKGEQLHPLQQAFMDCHGLQCGFCTPGMMMTGACWPATPSPATPKSPRRWKATSAVARVTSTSWPRSSRPAWRWPGRRHERAAGRWP